MTTVTSKSRPGSIVAEAYRLAEIDARRMKRIGSMVTRKPDPTPETSKKNAPPSRAKDGKPSKGKS